MRELEAYFLGTLFPLSVYGNGQGWFLGNLKFLLQTDVFDCKEKF